MPDNPKLLAIALSLAATTAAFGLAGCTHEQEKVLSFLGADPLPAALIAADPAPVPVAADEVGTDDVVTPPEPSASQVADTTPPPVVVPDPTPPAPVLNEYQVWQTDPTYVCVPQFRIKSCTDWGEPVWLDNQMAWLAFGVVP